MTGLQGQATEMTGLQRQATEMTGLQRQATEMTGLQGQGREDQTTWTGEEEVSYRDKGDKIK